MMWWWVFLLYWITLAVDNILKILGRTNSESVMHSRLKTINHYCRVRNFHFQCIMLSCRNDRSYLTIHAVLKNSLSFYTQWLNHIQFAPIPRLALWSILRPVLWSIPSPVLWSIPSPVLWSIPTPELWSIPRLVLWSIPRQCCGPCQRVGVCV